MKRTHASRKRANATPSPGHPRVRSRGLDAHRLATIRGGAGIGIAVDVVNPLPPIMTQQHNEILIEH